ncbi:MAG: glycosyltransferase family 2 protein [Planctomycetota bacterium]
MAEPSGANVGANASPNGAANGAARGARGTVGAVLLNWRQPELTCQCLLDLCAAAVPGLSVLVIDNGSADGSAAQLAAAVEAACAGGVDCELLALDRNLGFTGGMNRGFDWARARDCEFVLVLNNDLRLPVGFLQPLVATLQNDARVAAVAPTVVYPDGRVWAQGGSLGFHPNALRLRGHGRPPAPITAGPEAVDFVPGACVLFRRSDLDAAGGFDDEYFMYWEDVELCCRLRARGRRVVWLPWVRVVHLGGASAGGKRSPLRKYLMAKNGLRFLRRHGRLSLWASLVVLDVLSLPVVLVRRPRAAWAKVCGLAAGLRGAPSSVRDVARWR